MRVRSREEEPELKALNKKDKGRTKKRRAKGAENMLEELVKSRRRIGKRGFIDCSQIISGVKVACATLYHVW